MPKVVDVAAVGSEGEEAPPADEVEESPEDDGGSDDNEAEEEADLSHDPNTSIDLGNRALLPPQGSVSPSDSSETDQSRLSGMSGRDFVK